MKDPLPRAIIKKKNAYEKGNRNDDTPAFSSRKKLQFHTFSSSVRWTELLIFIDRTFIDFSYIDTYNTDITF